MITHIVSKARRPIHAVYTDKNTSIAISGNAHRGAKLDFLAAKRFSIVGLIEKAKRSRVDSERTHDCTLHSRTTWLPRRHFGREVWSSRSQVPSGGKLTGLAPREVTIFETLLNPIWPRLPENHQADHGTDCDRTGQKYHDHRFYVVFRQKTSLNEDPRDWQGNSPGAERSGELLEA